MLSLTPYTDMLFFSSLHFIESTSDSGVDSDDDFCELTHYFKYRDAYRKKMVPKLTYSKYKGRFKNMIEFANQPEHTLESAAGTFIRTFLQSGDVLSGKRNSEDIV